MTSVSSRTLVYASTFTKLKIHTIFARETQHLSAQEIYFERM
jgi:hypothetical protein